MLMRLLCVPALDATLPVRGQLRLIVLGLLLALGVTRAAADETYDDCIAKSGDTNVAYSRCGTAYIEREAARLGTAWERLTNLIADLERTKADLQAEQDLWNAFAQRACQALSNGDWGRDGQVLQSVKCRARILADRIAALEVYLEYFDSDRKGPAALPVPPPVSAVPAGKPSTPPSPVASPIASSAAQPPATLGSILLRILFPADVDQPPKEAEAELRQLVEKLKGTSERIALRAFASEADEGLARRKALTRAIAVRRFLGDSGVEVGRIDFRFLGQSTDGGPADRVDIHLLGR